MQRYLQFIVVFILMVLSWELKAQAGYAAQLPEKYNFQTKPFRFINQYPRIEDSLAFIGELKRNCNLAVDDPGDADFLQRVRINCFKKIRIYGSTLDYYLVEFDWRYGCYAAFPWKYQLIFDIHGKLIKILDGLRYELLKVFPQEEPFLLIVVSTGHGNGGHELYRFRKDSLTHIAG